MIDSLGKVSEQESDINSFHDSTSQFFLKIAENPSYLDVLRAVADPEQYKTLIFVQGILNRVDSSLLESKLEKISEAFENNELPEMSPLTLEELGSVLFCQERYAFLDELKKHGVQGIDEIHTFWAQMTYLGSHRALSILRQKTTALFSDSILGFILDREDSNRTTSMWL